MRIQFILKNILASLTFVLVFIQCYISFLNFYFEYAGFSLFKRDILFLIYSVLLSLLPMFFYRGFNSISSFIAIFIYVLLYVPIVLTFALGSDLSVTEIFIIEIVFAFSMIVLFLADRALLNKYLMINRMDLSKFILYLTIFTCIYLLFVYRSNLKFVSFEDVYALRSSNNKLVSDSFTGYLSSWLSSFMIPICLAYGVFAKKRIYFTVGSLACLILYMSTAAKGTIILPFIYIAFNFLFSKKRIKNIYIYFVLSITIPMLFILYNNKLDMFSSILLARTVGNGGYLTMWYHDFFLTHPKTYYSHINVINALTDGYPYKFDLGLVIGGNYWSDEVNANANFWATDGIAAMGISGVLIISIISYFLLRIINFVTKDYNKVFALLCFIPFIGSLLNTSIFSSLLGGGGIFVILFFTFHKEKDNKNYSKTTELN